MIVQPVVEPMDHFTALVLVVLHHVGGDAAVEAVGHLDGVVDRVLHQGPGREGGARHQDGAVEQACRG